MAVVITRPVSTLIDTAGKTLDYLATVYNQPRSPFSVPQTVRVTDRSALPNDIGAYNVGYVVFCPAEEPICSVLLLSEFGRPVVASIPKAHLEAI